ncbi:helix-turn-helix domain-containing protein [Brevundimonas sp.]|uniref:helix-turn-helix domain-containing protein n=1 Tax=Brevundimonas sp. TaxID=1871086 RepID=UPI003D1492E3
MDQDQELKSLKRGLRALILLSRYRSLTVSEAARRLDLPRTTAERVMMTLESESFIVRDPDSKRFSLGPRVLALAGGFSAEDQLTTVAGPLLLAKTKEIGWPLAIAVPQGERMSVRVTTDPSTSLWLHKRHAGSEIAMAAVSSGIMHMACLEDGERGALIRMLQASDDPAQALAHERGTLDRWLEAARRDGFCIEPQSGAERSISVPLCENGRIRAVLVMMFMARGVSNDALTTRFAPELKALAAEIESQVFPG